MPNRQITINQLIIRAKGLDPQVARRAVSGLGAAILAQLVEQPDAQLLGQPFEQSRQIPDLNLGTVVIRGAHGRQDAAQVRGAIAQAVVVAIAPLSDPAGSSLTLPERR